MKLGVSVIGRRNSLFANKSTFGETKSVWEIKLSHYVEIRRGQCTRFEGEDETYSNLTPSIRELSKRRLLHVQNHPLSILKQKIKQFFNEESNKQRINIDHSNAKRDGHENVDFEQFHTPKFHFFDDLNPIVTIEQNFDTLLTPIDHPSRKKDESYYLSKSHLLRCHMTAHQVDLLNRGIKSALFCGDVYRRDAIDATHYPVFHQLDGVRIFTKEDINYIENHLKQDADKYIENDMKNYLQGLAKYLFGNSTNKWVDAYFPFTHPSWELEILFNPNASSSTLDESAAENWLEVLGSGLVHSKIISKTATPDAKGWAFGLGLERWAMVLFNIPDIRLFWSSDPRFLSQFKDGQISKFVPFSKFPPCTKDITFWISPSFTENNFCELVREIAGDIVENVKLIDQFTHPKTQRESRCYRIIYRSMERTLTNEEVNEINSIVRDKVTSILGVELR